jgi:hypothetical protein
MDIQTRTTTPALRESRRKLLTASEAAAIRLQAIEDTLRAITRHGGGDWSAEPEHVRAAAEELGVPYLMLVFAEGDSNILAMEDLQAYVAWMETRPPRALGRGVKPAKKAT